MAVGKLPGGRLRLLRAGANEIVVRPGRVIMDGKTKEEKYK